MSAPIYRCGVGAALQIFNQDLVGYYYLVIETSLISMGLRCYVVTRIEREERTMNNL